MTCIVGLVHNGVTYIGGDSLGSNGYSKTVRKDKKVFKLKGTKETALGYTTSFRMGQLLMYGKDLVNERQTVNHEYLVTEFIPAIQKLFEDGGYGTTNSGEKSAGCFLLGHKDKLYKIEPDYQVGESFLSYDTCGCGESHALGSLHSTEGLGLTPEERIRKALQAASEFSVGVAPPFYIINTYDNHVTEYKD